MELALDITLVVTSVLIVLLVLLHGAKGGGLSTLFGGGVQSSLSGSTVVEKNLDRLTLCVTGIWLVSIVGVGLQIKYGTYPAAQLRTDRFPGTTKSTAPPPLSSC